LPHVRVLDTRTQQTTYVLPAYRTPHSHSRGARQPFSSARAAREPLRALGHTSATRLRGRRSAPWRTEILRSAWRSAECQAIIDRAVRCRARGAGRRATGAHAAGHCTHCGGSGELDHGCHDMGGYTCVLAIVFRALSSGAQHKLGHPPPLVCVCVWCARVRPHHSGVRWAGGNPRFHVSCEPILYPSCVRTILRLKLTMPPPPRPHPLRPDHL